MKVIMQLALIFGAITLQLNDGTSYGVEYNGWTPRVARHGDEWVVEEIPLHVRGATGAAALANLSALAEVMDAAGRSWAGEGRTPVLLSYTPTNSTTTWYTAVRQPEDSEPLILPARVNDAANQEIDGVGLRLLRRAKWLKLDQTNLVANGGFEDWTGGYPDDWSIAGATVAQEDTIVRAGAASADITSSAILETSIYQTVTVETGSTYLVSGWLYLVSGKAATLEIRQLSSAVARVSAEGVGDWQHVEQLVTACDDELGVYLLSLDGVARFYADEIQVVALDSAEDGDTATIAADNGDLAQLSFANVAEPFLSPTKITISDVRFGTYHTPATVIVADKADRIKVIDSYDFGWLLGGPFSETADTAAHALGGNVARFTPVATTTQRITVRDYDLEFYSIKRVAIFANVRNNSSTTTFTLRALSFAPGGTSYARPILVAGDATPSPQWRYLGSVVSNRDGAFFIDITPSAASGTLDIDAVVLVGLDEHVSIVTVDQGANVGTSEPGDLIINHRMLSGYYPQVEVIQNDIATEWGARGDLAVYTTAPVIDGILLATGGDTGVNFWRQVASTAVVENTWTASRLPARIVAE